MAQKTLKKLLWYRWILVCVVNVSVYEIEREIETRKEREKE